MTAESDNSLPEFLATRARGSSDTRLALDVVIGLVVVLAFGLWRVPGWHMFVAAGSCFLFYGTWAIANRELADSPPVAPGGRTALRTLAAMSAVLGVAAGVFLMLAVVATLIGRVIS